NAAGWYNGDVTVAWTCSDALSGIAGGVCPANDLVTGEGDNLSASASVKDKAGNTTNAVGDGIKIDRTAPTTRADAPAGWNNQDVTVNLTAHDALSSVDATYYILDNGSQQSGNALTISTQGIHTLKFWSVDKAGNAESEKSVQVQIDLTPPTISH